MGETFHDRDFTAATFDDVLLQEATFHRVGFDRSTFTNADFVGVTIQNAALIDVEIHAEVRNRVINGLDVAPLVEAHLDAQQPGREKMRPTDPAGFREAWDLLEELWDGIVEGACTLEARRPGSLHESVDGEWSFIQTLRHLVYATDVWVRRALLGDPRPWHPLSLPFDEMTGHPEVPWDREVRPPLAEVLALQADRQSTVRRVLDDLTDDRLATTTEPVEGPSWPPADRYPVSEVLRTVLNEEWEHRRYAERDLTALENR